jgi:hypothetical protein
MAARARIKEQLGTADLNYDLVFCNLAIDQSGKSFMDHEIHSILQRSGFSKVQHTEEKTNGEWFAVNLETVKNAFEADATANRSIQMKLLPNPTRLIFVKDRKLKPLKRPLLPLKKVRSTFSGMPRCALVKL